MAAYIYNECIALIANACAEAYRLRDWCALEFYITAVRPDLRWSEIIKDWVATD